MKTIESGRVRLRYKSLKIKQIPPRQPRRFGMTKLKHQELRSFLPHHKWGTYEDGTIGGWYGTGVPFTELLPSLTLLLEQHLGEG